MVKFSLAERLVGSEDILGPERDMWKCSAWRLVKTPQLRQCKVTKFHIYAVLKREVEKRTFLKRAKFFFANLKAQWDEDDGRILLGDNTGDGTVTFLVWWTSESNWTFFTFIYKVVQTWPGQTVTCLHTNSPDHIWTTLYIFFFCPGWALASLTISLHWSLFLALCPVPNSHLP